MAPFASMLKSKRYRKQQLSSPPGSPVLRSTHDPTWNTSMHGTHVGRKASGDPTSSSDSLDAPAAVTPAGGQGPQQSQGQESDVLEQFTSFAFPLPPVSTFPRSTASGNPSIRFAAQDPPPRSHYKVSLRLSQDDPLGDLFATGLIVPSGEIVPEVSPRSRIPRVLTQPSRSRSATVPLLNQVDPSPAPRRAPPRPILIVPQPNAIAYANGAESASDTSSHPVASSSRQLAPTPVQMQPSPMIIVAAPSGPAETAADKITLQPVDEKAIAASSPITRYRGRLGSSPRSRNSRVDPDEDVIEISLDSKPQPSLPNSPPFQFPTDDSEDVGMPSRPPRSTNPRVPNIPDTSMDNYVSRTLARQSTLSATTTIGGSGLGSPTPRDLPISRMMSLTAGDLPFTPGFLMPTDGFGGDNSRMRVDSATLPLEFETMQMDFSRQRIRLSSSPGPSSLVSPLVRKRTSSIQPAVSPAPSSSAPSAFTAPSPRERPGSKRSASLTELQDLGKRASSLREDIIMRIDPAGTTNDQSTPNMISITPASESPTIVEEKDESGAVDLPGHDTTAPTSTAFKRMSRTSSNATPPPPQIIIPPLRSSRGSLTPGSVTRSPSPGTTPAISTPGTASTSRSLQTAGFPHDHQVYNDFTSPGEGITMRPSSQHLREDSFSSSTGKPSHQEKDVAKLARGLQQLSSLASVLESHTETTAEVAARRGSDPSSLASSSTVRPPSLLEGSPTSTVAVRAGTQGHVLRHRSFSKAPRAAPVPAPPVPSLPAGMSPPSPATVNISPLNISRNRVSPITSSPSVRRLQRERSASDATPLTPRHDVHRSVSISELKSAASPVPVAPSQAPSSFSATISRVFQNGLSRKRSDWSLKGKDKEKETEADPQEEEEEEADFASLDASRKSVPPPLTRISSASRKSERRNTPSQFPQTPRPFSISSSAEQHFVAPPPTAGPSTARPSTTYNTSSSLQPAAIPHPAPTSAPGSFPSGPPRTVAAARAAVRSAALPIAGAPRRPSRPPGGLVLDNSAPATLSPPKPTPAIVPKFESVPVPWKGLTLDAAQWTFSSKELQDIVGKAIRQSAEASSIRLLNPDVLDHQLPNETYRLELLREDIKARYKFQVRRRRLLMRSLNLYIDGSDPETAKRLTEELGESAETCDCLSQELFQVTDQLAQMNQLSQRHTASALSMALRKLNASFIKAKGEAIDYQLQLAMLEAERDEAWATAESIERELDHYKHKHGVSNDYDFLLSPAAYPPSSWGSRANSRASRVSAARKTSTRASKASLRLSKRSTRSSASGSLRFGSSGPRASGSSGSGGSRHGHPKQESVPAPAPVPPLPPKLTRSTSAHNLGAHSRRASWAASPTSMESRTMFQAQNQLFEMLGIPHEDIDRSVSVCGEPHRGRSYSAPSSPSSLSSPAMRRVSLPGTVGLLESPRVIAALMALPSS